MHIHIILYIIRIYMCVYTHAHTHLYIPKPISQLHKTEALVPYEQRVQCQHLGADVAAVVPGHPHLRWIAAHRVGLVDAGGTNLCSKCDALSPDQPFPQSNHESNLFTLFPPTDAQF
jgi:hypothetical protein